MDHGSCRLARASGCRNSNHLPSISAASSHAVVHLSFRFAPPMSTCSTATSARRDLRRRLFCSVDTDDAAAGHQLEIRLRDLEQDWRAYKASRTGAPRSRSATTAVTCPGDDDPSDLPRCSPRRLVYSTSSPSSCSCPRHCAARRRHSASSSSRTVAIESSVSPAGGGGGGVAEDATTETKGRRCVTGDNNTVMIKWLAAIAFVAVVGVIMVMAVLVVEPGMDDDEFLVPT